MKIKRSAWIFPVVLLAAVLMGPPACKKSGQEAPSPGGKAGGGAGRGRMSFPVEVDTVGVRSLIFTVGAVGAVEAFEKVQVTSRVAGVVDRVQFSEGIFAKVGDTLVEIEPERFKLAVESAQATYDRAAASKADAEAGLKRREAVIAQNPGLIPGEELETWRTKVSLAAADLAQTLAALNQAKLNLHDAYVRAPFSGAIQTRTVQTGQYVQVGTVLATLVRRDPLLLRFRVPERDAAQLRAGLIASFQVRDNPKTYTAKIVHVAASADEAGRLVEVTGQVVDSGDASLRPGSFAEITIPVSSPREAPVIPQTAIRPSERGFIAFVVENEKAQERVLTIGLRTLDGQAEVLSGLKPGETLVVRGAEALQTGFPVRIVPPGGVPQTAEEKTAAQKTESEKPKRQKPAGDKPPAPR
jgi:multidrug efflux system membrane fusion protein